MKTSSTCCPEWTKRSIKNLTGNIKPFLLLLLFLGVAEFGSAQSCADKHPSPSCNVEGPLAACLYGGNITVTITEDFSQGNISELYLSLPAGPGNTSGGSIVSGPTEVSYLGSVLTASVILAPGNSEGTILLEVQDSVRYTDGCIMTNGCGKSISIINVTATAQNSLFCTGGTSTVTLTSLSQADSIAYILGTGANADTNYTGIFPGQSAGIDTFTVVAIEPQAYPYATLFCPFTLIDTIRMSSPPAAPICSNNGPLTCTLTSVTLSANGCASTPGISYSWSGPNGYSSSLQCPANATVAGTYTVTADSTVSGCSSSCTTTITSNTTPPDLSCSGGTLTCTTTSITLSANSCSETPGVTYSWSGPGQYSSSSQCPSVSVAGTYTVTATNTVNGCTSTCTATVDSNITPPDLSCSGGTLTCTTTSITLSANSCSETPGVTYSWSGPGQYSSSSQCPSVSVAGTYTVTATNTVNGCTSTCTATVGSNITPPDLSCSGGTLTCTITSITLSANNCSETPGVTYSWSGPGQYSSSSQCPSVSVAGTYTVTATNTVNGCTSTCTATVGSNITPPDLSCSGGTLTCTITSITLSANNCSETPGVTYSWSGPGQYSSSSQCPSVSVAGTYTVTATNTVNGCTSTCTATVGSNITPPDLSCSGGTLTCTTTSITLSANSCSETPGVTYSWSGPGQYSSSSQCPSVSVAGTYTVTATNTVNGCTSTCTATVDSNITPPDLSCSGGTLTCTTTSITLSANSCSETPGVTYSWSGPGQYSSSSQCPSVSVAGTYTVTATNTVNGCTSTCTATVGSNITPPDLSCSGGTLTCTTTSITLSANSCSETPGVTYSWSGPGQYSSSSQCPSVSVAGTYTVTATNTVNGCTSTCTATVGSNITPPDLSCSGGTLTCTTTSITLSANSCTETPGVTYSWSGPGQYSSSSQCPSVSVAGTYTVTATNTVNGCTSTCTATVGSNLTPPDLSCSGGTLTCTTTSITLSANSCSETPGVTYSWSGPGQYSSSSQCPSVSVAGTYTVTATNTVNGCTSTCTATVGSNITPPDLSCSGGTLTCTTTSITLSANSCSETPGVTYSWSGPGQYSSSSQCPSVSVAGTYTVTATNTVNGCTSTCTATVGSNITPPSVSINPQGPTTFCQGGSVELCAVGASSYIWNPGSVAATCITVSTAGTYSVVGTDADNGCTATTSIGVTVNIPTYGDTTAQACVSFTWYGTVFTSDTNSAIHIFPNGNAAGCDSTVTLHLTINQLPTVSITPNGNTAFCEGGYVQLCASSGSSYSWSPNGQTDQCITVYDPGHWVVQVTNANGCSDTAGIYTTVGLPPTVTVTPTNGNCTTGGTGSACANPSGGTGPGTYTYSWNTGDASICINVTQTETYTVTITDANHCTATNSALVTINTTPPSLSCSNNGPLTCTTSSITLSANNCTATDGISYSWSGPNGYTSSSQCPSDASVAGTYTVTATNAANGCTSSCTTTVGLNNTPPNANCAPGCTLTCTHPTMIIGVNNCDGANGVSYAWTGPNDFASALQCLTISNGGTYTVTVTNTGNGCTSSCTTTVGVDNTPPNANCVPGCTLTCAHPTMIIGVNNCDGANGVSYAWTGPNGFASPLQCLTINSGGTYTVTVTNTGNGCTSSCSTTVGVNNTIPVLTCNNNGPLTCTTTSVTLSANGCTETPGITYSWSGPNGYSSSSQCPVVSVAGTYTVTATSAANGCTATCTTNVCSNTTPPSLVCSNSGPFTCTTSTATLSANSCTVTSGITYSWRGPNSYSSSSQCPVVSVAGTYTVTATNAANGCTSSCTTTVTGNSGTPPNCSICITTCTLNHQHCVCTLNHQHCNGPNCTLNHQHCQCTLNHVHCFISETNCHSNHQHCVCTLNHQHCTGPNCTLNHQHCQCTLNHQHCFTGLCSNNISCNGGSLTLIASGGTSYKWSTGATTASITVSTSGTYTVTVTNSSGCTSSCSQLVTISSPPSCTISGNSSICSGQSTPLCAPAGTGLAYSWSGGATTQCINVNAAGTYSVTVTNSSGCSSQCSKCVTVNAPPSCSIGVTTCQLNHQHCVCTLNHQHCNGPNCTLNHQHCQCTLNHVHCFFSESTCQSNHQHCVCTLNHQHCNGPNCTLNHQHCQCTLNHQHCFTGLNNENNFCNVGPVTLFASGGTSYLWSNGATTSSISVTKSGTYSVTVTNSSGCTSSCSRTITIGTPPSCTINGNASICSGASTPLCAPEGTGLSYSWSNGATTQCINAGSAGTYSVTVTNSSGCSSECSKCVTVNAPPSCNISGNCIIKQGQCTNLCAPNGCSSYKWNTGANCSSITVNCAGNYCVTVTNSYGCSSNCCVCVTNQQNSCGRLTDGASTNNDPMNSFGNMDVLAFPNPFNGIATIEFMNTGEISHVRVEVYSIDGNKVATLFDADAEAGVAYKEEFDATNLAEGMYIYKIISDDNVINGKLMLLKH